MRVIVTLLLILTLGAAAQAQCTVSGSAGELVYNSGSGGGCDSSAATVTSGGALTLPATGAGLSVTNNATVGGTLGVTGATTASGGLNIPAANLVWGSGPLTSGHAPIFQDATTPNSFTGTTATAWSAFGMWLRQSDDSSNVNNGAGVEEILNLDGSGVIGDRIGGSFTVSLNAQSGNTTSQGYTGLTGRCTLNATDVVTGGLGSSCIGGNMVASIGAGKTGSVAGLEIDTFEGSGATVEGRFGLTVVDTINGSGVQAGSGRDDIGISIDNQYDPSSTLGWKIGLQFGALTGHFPVATGGTLIGGTGPAISLNWTVANGIDWSLGAATGFWEKFGTVWSVTGAGVASATGYAVGATVGVSCAAGTVNLTTLVVTNGIVTHC